MKIKVAIKTNAKQEVVQELEDGSFLVKVNASPVEGKANKRAIELLADYFDRPKTSIALVGGQKSKNKIFEI